MRPSRRRVTPSRTRRACFRRARAGRSRSGPHAGRRSRGPLTVDGRRAGARVHAVRYFSSSGEGVTSSKRRTRTGRPHPSATPRSGVTRMASGAGSCVGAGADGRTRAPRRPGRRRAAEHGPRESGGRRSTCTMRTAPMPSQRSSALRAWGSRGRPPGARAGARRRRAAGGRRAHVAARRSGGATPARRSGSAGKSVAPRSRSSCSITPSPPLAGVERAGEARLHRAAADAERRRDLLLGQVEEVAQPHGEALLLAEPVERGEELGRDARTLERALGGRGRVPRAASAARRSASAARRPPDRGGSSPRSRRSRAARAGTARRGGSGRAPATPSRSPPGPRPRPRPPSRGGGRRCGRRCAGVRARALEGVAVPASRALDESVRVVGPPRRPSYTCGGSEKVPCRGGCELRHSGLAEERLHLGEEVRLRRTLSGPSCSSGGPIDVTRSSVDGRLAGKSLTTAASSRTRPAVRGARRPAAAPRACSATASKAATSIASSFDSPSLRSIARPEDRIRSVDAELARLREDAREDDALAPPVTSSSREEDHRLALLRRQLLDAETIPPTVTISPSRRRSSSFSVQSVLRRSWSRMPWSGCSET